MIKDNFIFKNEILRVKMIVIIFVRDICLKDEMVVFLKFGEKCLLDLKIEVVLVLRLLEKVVVIFDDECIVVYFLIIYGDND